MSDAYKPVNDRTLADINRMNAQDTRAKPSKSSVLAALRDAEREGAPMDVEELAAEFGISAAEIEEILES